MSRLLVCPMAFLMACVTLQAQQASKDALEAVQTIHQLRSIEVPPSSKIQFGPPPQVPGLLRQLNRQLRTLIVDVLNDKNRGAEVANEEEVLSELRNAGWEEVSQNKWNAYGEIVDVNFDWKLGYDPALLVISTQLWIPCGSSDPDSAIYVFQGEKRQWNLVLATDADFDALGRTAESGLQYAISPASSNGHWFLGVANAPPSCRVPRRDLRYKVLRPGRSADEPVLLLDRREPVIPEFDPPFQLRAERDWFSLTRGKTRKLDGEPGIVIARYEIGETQVTRLQPFALTPEDFIDEWVQLNWADASKWSTPAAQSEIQQWHSKLHSLANDSTEFQSVTRCSEGKNGDAKWLIDLWIDQEQNPSSDTEMLYIALTSSNGSQFIDAVYKERPKGCPGKTRPQLSTDTKLPNW
jgi:hypothetical protein